jgi:hypothetical protein
VFGDITPCSLLKVNRRFTEVFHLHLQGWRVSRARNQNEAGIKQRRAYIPEGRTLYNNHCDNLKAYMILDQLAKKRSAFDGSQNFTTIFIRVRFWIITLGQMNTSAILHPLTSRSIILSYHLGLGQVASFFHDSPPKFCMPLSYSKFVHIFACIIEKIIYFVIIKLVRALTSPLWSSGQSFWLQIQKSWVRFPALPDFLRSSGAGNGSTQPREDNWGATWKKKVAAPVYETRLTTVGIRCADHATPSIRKIGTTSPTSGGRLVGIVRSRTKATEFSF